MNKLLLLNLSFCSLFLSIVFDNTSSQSDKKYTNPILADFYPDPGIWKVEDNYYLVNYTFLYFPGIPVLHSKDLINWKSLQLVVFMLCIQLHLAYPENRAYFNWFEYHGNDEVYK